MKKAVIMIISGFLGSGKTASIVAIAKYLIGEGRKVGIIVNDSDSRSIDLEYLKQKGFAVTGIMDGCGKCSFHEILEKINKRSDKGELDYILIEPAGFCTGLAPGIIKALKEADPGKYRMYPISVLADPNRLISEFLSSQKHLPDEVGYLMLKQMEEADIIVVNKADTLSKEELQKIDKFLRERFPGRRMIYINAMINSGIDLWMDQLEKISTNSLDYAGRNVDVDCEMYAGAEAKLARLNLYCDFIIQNKISGNYLLNSLADRIKENIKNSKHELAHLKIYLESGYATCKLGCISVSGENEFDKKVSVPIGTGKLFINIRADIERKQLTDLIKQALDTVFKETQGTYDSVETE